MSTYYWVSKTSSNFNSAANWSLSNQGGLGGAGVPGVADHIVFNKYGTGSCTIDVPLSCLSFSVQYGYTGSIIDGGQTISVAGNIFIINDFAVLTSTGIWRMTANGTIENACSDNKFAELRILTSVIATTTNKVWTNKLVMSELSSLVGTGSLGFANPAASSFLTQPASATITVPIDICINASRSQGRISTTGDMHIYTFSAPVLTMTNNWTCANLYFDGYIYRQTEITPLLKTNGFDINTGAVSAANDVSTVTDIGLFNLNEFDPNYYEPLARFRADRKVYQDVAVQFNAADKSWLQITDAAQTGLDIGTDDYLISFWVYLNSATNGDIVLKTNAAGYEVIVNVLRKINFYHGDSSGYISVTTTTAIPLTTWTHVAIHVDRSSVATFYFNGVADITTLDVSGKALNGDNAASFRVGAATSNTTYFDGRLDSLMFFKKADLSAVAADMITWAYNSGVGRLCSDITEAQKTAWGAISGWELGENSGVRYDSWGTNHLSQSFANIMQPPVYGSELLTNGDFETLGGGGADVFGTWAEAPAVDGAVEDETVLVHAGSHAVKITVGSASSSSIYNSSVNVTSGLSYRLSFWTRGDGINAGRYYLTGGFVTPIQISTNIIGTNYTLVTYDFVATSTGALNIYMYSPIPGSGGYAYFDDVSLKAVTTAALLNGGFDDAVQPADTSIVANGEFTSDVASWSLGTSTSAASTAGGVSGNCVTITNTSTVFGAIYQALTTVVGQVYKVSVWHKNGNFAGGFFYVSSVLGSNTYFNSGALNNADWTETTCIFTATTTTTYIQLYVGDGTLNNTTLFDSISCIPIVSNFTSWTETTAAGKGAVYAESTDPYHGSRSLKFVIDAAGAAVQVYQPILTVGKLYASTLVARRTAGTNYLAIGDDSSGVFLVTPAATYTAYSGSFRSTSTNFSIRRGAVIANTTIDIDSVTLQAAEILAAPGIARGLAKDNNFATQLNGANQYLIYTGTAFNPGVGDFSLGCAFYLDRLPSVGSVATIMSMGAASAELDYMWVYIDVNSKISVVFNDATGAVTTLSTTLLPIGVWYTLVVNFDRDGNCTVSVNGSTTGYGSTSIAAKSTSVDPGNFSVGQYAFVSTARYLSGRIDNAFYANRILTADEITWLHNDGKWRQWDECGVAGTDGVNLTSAVMRGFWEFDDVSNLGLDSTTNEINLTPQGSPTQGPGINYYGGVVSRWESDYGSAVALQDTLANRPVYTSESLNGYEAITFDGTDDYLRSTFALTQPYTVFVVAKATAVNKPIIDGVTAAALLSRTAADKYGINAGTALATTAAADSDFHVLMAEFNDDDSALYVDGTATAGDAGAADGGGITIGANQALNAFLAGAVAEVIVYNGSLSAFERSAVYHYLSSKYYLGAYNTEGLASIVFDAGSTSEITGDMDFTSITVSWRSTLVFGGTADQLIISDGTTLLPNLTINKPGGTLTFTTDIVCGNLIIKDGTVDINGVEITCNNNIVNDGAPCLISMVALGMLLVI